MSVAKSAGSCGWRVRRRARMPVLPSPVLGGEWQVWSAGLLRLFQPAHRVSADARSHHRQPGLTERHVQPMIGWSDLPGIELWSIKVLLSGTAPGSHQDQGAVGAAADVWAHRQHLVPGPGDSARLRLLRPRRHRICGRASRNTLADRASPRVWIAAMRSPTPTPRDGTRPARSGSRRRRSRPLRPRALP